MALKYNLYPEFFNQNRADWFVADSGLYNWDWNHPTMSQDEIASELGKFLYHKADGMTSFEDIMYRFIKSVLRMNPKDFSFNDPNEV